RLIGISIFKKRNYQRQHIKIWFKDCEIQSIRRLLKTNKSFQTMTFTTNLSKRIRKLHDCIIPKIGEYVFIPFKDLHTQIKCSLPNFWTFKKECTKKIERNILTYTFL